MKSLDAIREYAEAEGMAEGLAEGRTEGRLEVRRQIALALIQDGLYTFDDIARICSMTLQQVQELAATLKP